MIKVKVFTFNIFSENTFILWDDERKEAAIVDPGMSSRAEEIILEDFVSSNELSIKFMINTHCHIDHILGCKFIKEKYNSTYYVPEKDLILIENAQQQAEMFGLTLELPPLPDKYIDEKAELTLGKSKITFLFTPGHTAGEYCLYLENEKICLTGDVLFKEGIGRTDLWGGNYDVLINSIETKLFTLPDDVTICPGHGDISTIGYEKQYNPFLV
jgi:glyoxylase-like metal-dependent hydrolase (beta-lactamase superfamily II)